MRAVILTAGLGTRLEPVTSIYNKHLVLVYDKPVLHHLVVNLLEAGFTRFCFVLGGPHADQVRNYCLNQFSGISSFAIQKEPTGIAEAVYTARGWVENNVFGVFLGDQFFIDQGRSIAKAAKEFLDGKYDAAIWARELPEPWHHNLVRFDGHHELVEIVEKPHEKQPQYQKAPGYTMIGFHLFRPPIFDIIRDQKPGHHKGEKNLADTITMLVKQGGKIKVYPFTEEWFDCGTPENVYLAARARRAQINHTR